MSKSSSSASDIDPVETQEWLEALGSVIQADGEDRAQYLLNQLLSQAKLGNKLTATFNTPYCNTIEPKEEAQLVADRALEQKLRALIRWNAMVMVVKAQNIDPSLGGHIGTFASIATIYEIGFNHFWRSPQHESGGDLIYFQGHTAPGIYARSYLAGDLEEEQLVHFRREVQGRGLSSYPHPWLMPNYWQFPTVSMGLGPLQAIYQARFMKYLAHRNLIQAQDRKIWCFCGDGEMDEPESLGALTIAAREKLDNLIFVVNCNLQRLDGPVRGNGKIIQELEALFKGAGWKVIKTIWGGQWDPLLAKDQNNELLARMEQALDGEYQNYKAKDGAYTREHFFGSSESLKALVADYSDEQIKALNRGGHDPQKVYASFAAASATQGQPTVLLMKTVKGYGLGKAGEAQNTAHNTKKLNQEAIVAFRDRFNLPIPDDKLEDLPFYRPAKDSPEIQYLLKQRHKLGGPLPWRRQQATEGALNIPKLETFAGQLKASGQREISTTMAFVRILSTLVKDKAIGSKIVPIVPDEARTFGMEGLFRQMGIYSPVGQNYKPEDQEQVMFYKEAQDGQILEEGINEAGAFCSWIAAATAYSNYNLTMIPFYIYYSMFGFQRIGDLAWAAGDSRCRGFLLGATAGRTTLNGEGLQHQDGHSHIMANLIPNCISYDPTFAYELAVIIHYGLERMYVNQEDVYFYITLMNENYFHPALPEAAIEGIKKGMYLFKQGSEQKVKVQLLGSGTIFNEILAAQQLLAQDFKISADVWSVTSFNELRKEGLTIERANRLATDSAKQVTYVEQCLAKTQGPIIAATDYVKLFADQIRNFVPRTYITLGTDGFGRSDTRATLRKHFEVDRYHIAYSAIKALVEDGQLASAYTKKAWEKYIGNVQQQDPTFI